MNRKQLVPQIGLLTIGKFVLISVLSLFVFPISHSLAGSASPLPSPIASRWDSASTAQPNPPSSPVVLLVDTGYVSDEPQRFTDGYSSVTVDNSQNGTDVIVKLFSLDTDPIGPIRVFFIRAGEQFTVETVRAGNYDIRYRDLASGNLFRTASFQLTETEQDGVIYFDNLTLTLYPVPNGNLPIEPISDDEF